MNRSLLTALCVGIVTLPLCLFALEPTATHYSHKLTLLLFCMLILSLTIESVPLKLLMVYCVSWQFILLIFSWATGISRTLFDSGMDYTVFVLLMSVLYNSIANVEIPLYWENLICSAICAMVLVQCVIGAMQINSACPLTYIGVIGRDAQSLKYSLTTGSVGNPNFFGALLAFSIPFFCRKRWCYALCAVVPMLLFSRSEIAILSIVLGLSIAYTTKDTWLLLLVPILAISVVLYKQSPGIWHPLSGSLGIRIEQIVHCWDSITATALGFVFGGSAAALAIYEKSVIHCDYADFTYMYGVIGISLVLWFLYKLPRWSRKLTASFIAICINATMSLPGRIPILALFAVIVFGLMSNKSLIERSLKCQTTL